MSAETEIFTLLKAICPRVFPDVAPPETPMPFITYSGIGGPSMRYASGEAMESHYPTIQVNTWSTQRSEALTMIRQAEEAICTATSINAEPQGEPLWQNDTHVGAYGCLQRFDVFATR